jgi:sRNA-binding carbon storage regulator CsrA
MLVLNRLRAESVLVGRKNVVTVVSIGKNRVRFCVDAPYLQVSRDERPGSGKITTGKLVFSRKVGQGFNIAGLVHVVLVRVNGHNARVGFQAHPDVRILRAELDGALVLA